MNAQLLDRLEMIVARPHMFEVILNEDTNQHIYEEFDMTEVKRTLGNFKNQLVSVISLEKENEEFYGLFKHGGEIIGWTRLSDSWYVYPKRLDSVKVNMSSFRTHPFNSMVGITKDLVLALQNRLLTSKSYIVVGDELLELVFMKSKLQGFVKSADLHRGIALEELCSIKGDVKRYKDSNFDVALPERKEDFEAVLTLYFPERNLAKLEKRGWAFWMEASDLEYDFAGVHAESSTIEEDVHHYYNEERKKAKSVLEGLLRRQLQLEKEVERTKSRLIRVEALYRNLKNSKLGRIQVKIWERRKRSAE